MAQFEAFEDGVEDNGPPVRSMLEGVSELSNVFEKRTTETLADDECDCSAS